MQNDHLRAALMGGWILAVGALGYISGVSSFGAWAAVAVLSLAPPVVMARLWSAPEPSMSESIRDEIR